MKTDVSLKRLFKACGRDFVWLTGDQDATVLSVDVFELQEIRRSVDCLIRLHRGREVYYRHIEFQAKNDPRMAERCFRYNAMLLLELQAPVLTTVIYLSPPGPIERELVYRVMLGDVEVNAWRFGVVRLWEIEAEAALGSKAPGLMALVPLLKGGEPATIWAAARQIRNLMPGPRMSDPESILWLLAQDRYNSEQLGHAIGGNVMQALLELLKKSPLWQEAEAEGEIKGRAEGEIKGRAEGEIKGRAEGEATGEAKGRLAAQRKTLLKLVELNHPDLLALAAERAEACSDSALLESWILATSRPDDDALARLLISTP